MSVLLQGVAGAGTSALAAHVASISDFPYIQMLSPASLVGLDDFQVQRPPERDPPPPHPYFYSLTHSSLPPSIARFLPVNIKAWWCWGHDVLFACSSTFAPSLHSQHKYRTMASYACLFLLLCCVYVSCCCGAAGARRGRCNMREEALECVKTHTITRSWNESLA